jgi:hypothetical protein
MLRRIRPFFLFLALLSFSIGWRAEGNSFYPVSMTLSGDRLFVSDLRAGIRIMDVSDPAAPTEISTIPLEGNRGTAVKDDYLFANEYNGLIVFREVGDRYLEVARINDGYDFVDGGDNGFKGPVDTGGGFGCACTSTDYDASGRADGGGSSSYATFAIAGNRLYHVRSSSLVTYDITNPTKPIEVDRKYLGWRIETIYPTDDLLFIGSSTGMFILTRPANGPPAVLSELQHVEACDPVVVSGDVAFVTLRGSGGCGTRDALLCVDVSDPTAPKVIVDRNVLTPWGLVVEEPYLIVSNGDNGFTIYDVERPQEPASLGRWSERPTRDFLWQDNVLFVLGSQSLHTYDVTDPRNPVYLARAVPALP